MPSTALGRRPARINPLIPTELVIDHSVIADVFARADAFRDQRRAGVQRNTERYQLLRWAQQASTTSWSCRPDTGICHQVNLEYLARVVFTRDGPDGVRGLPGHPGRHRLPHPDGQRAGRARLGGRRDRGRGGHARTADEHADPAGRRVQAHRRAAAKAPPPPIWYSPSRRCCAEPGWSASSSSSTAPASRTSVGGPRHHRQHEPRVRLDLRDLPDR